MVEGAGELKLDMGVLQEGPVGPWLCVSSVWARCNKAFHTKGHWESRKEEEKREWKMETAYLTLPW